MASRRLSVIALATLAIFSVSFEAKADDAQEAEELNSQGKARIKLLDLEGAAALFRQAIALDQDPRYFFNLCYTLEKSGKLEEARQACDSVAGSGDQRLEDKAAQLSGKIDEKLGPRPTEPSPPREGDPPVGPPAPAAVGPRPIPPPPMKPAKDPKRMMFGGVFGLASARMIGEIDSDSVFGLAIGSWALLPLAGNLDLVFEGQYVQRGGDYSDVGLGRLTVKNNYLDFGAAGRYGFGSAATSYYLEGGVTASILISTEGGFGGDIIETNVNPKDFAWNAGLGARLKSAIGAVDFRFRFMFGLLDLNVADAMAADAQPIFNRSILFQVGYWY